MHGSDEETSNKKEVSFETSGSWLGTAFTVNYQLGVYVKHDAWSVIAATEGWTALDLFRMGLLVAEAESAAPGVHRSSWSRRA